ncbi:MAG: alpha-N-acetylglucosaminidase N-terminal domain-containing protein, partial [Patescibacteria group bacterium]|nr:alpha-N-acetylglucosaminidase N-terminal domain-containing protein [Patescibacteria group bacterium]
MKMKKMMLFLFTFICLACLTISDVYPFNNSQNDGNENKSAVAAAQGIIERLLPAYANSFILASIPKENGFDVFEIESRSDKVIIRGSTGVAIASGLNWYLKYYCNCYVSWSGDQLNLPEILPPVKPKFRKVTKEQSGKGTKSSA